MRMIHPKDFDDLKRYIGNIVWLTTAFALVITVITVVLCRPLQIARRLTQYDSQLAAHLPPGTQRHSAPHQLGPAAAHGCNQRTPHIQAAARAVIPLLCRRHSRTLLDCRFKRRTPPGQSARGAATSSGGRPSLKGDTPGLVGGACWRQQHSHNRQRQAEHRQHQAQHQCHASSMQHQQ